MKVLVKIILLILFFAIIATSGYLVYRQIKISNPDYTNTEETSDNSSKIEVPKIYALASYSIVYNKNALASYPTSYATLENSVSFSYEYPEDWKVTYENNSIYFLPEDTTYLDNKLDEIMDIVSIDYTQIDSKTSNLNNVNRNHFSKIEYFNLSAEYEYTTESGTKVFYSQYEIPHSTFGIYTIKLTEDLAVSIRFEEQDNNYGAPFVYRKYEDDVKNLTDSITLL